MIAILGAGLAGLTAAHELIKRGVPGCDIVIFEKEDDVGGLAQTRTAGGHTFDLGPHRWFTKSDQTDRLWEEINQPDVLHLNQLTRIWYGKRFFNYPLAPANMLANLGIRESAAALCSYLLQLVKNRFAHSPPKDLEEAFIRQFGTTLYNTFFREYNLKLWGGTGCKELAPDWARQRVKNLSLGAALLDLFGLTRKGKVVSLVERFKYPTNGAGQTAANMASIITAAGGRILCSAHVTGVVREQQRLTRIIVTREGEREEYAIDYCISSLPIDLLASSIQAPLSVAAREAAEGLRYRDLLFIALFLDVPRVMQDNWIYVQDPSLSFNRFMDMGSWNPALSPPGATTMLFEVTCNVGGPSWNCDDDAWIERITGEFIREFDFVERERIKGGKVIRKTHAYPVYTLDYQQRLDTLKTELKSIGNLQLIGRNGLFRYNNMDHSMATGVAAARNYLGAAIDIEAINLDQEYHELKQGG